MFALYTWASFINGQNTKHAWCGPDIKSGLSLMPLLYLSGCLPLLTAGNYGDSLGRIWFQFSSVHSFFLWIFYYFFFYMYVFWILILHLNRNCIVSSFLAQSDYSTSWGSEMDGGGGGIVRSWCVWWILRQKKTARRNSPVACSGHCAWTFSEFRDTL